jgi:hypothetical protein
MQLTHSLSRKMTLILVIKLIALVAIYGLFFSGDHKIKVDAQRVQLQLFPADAPHASGE